MSGSSCGGPAPPQPRFTVVFQHTDEDLVRIQLEAAAGGGRAAANSLCVRVRERQKDEIQVTRLQVGDRR